MNNLATKEASPHLQMGISTQTFIHETNKTSLKCQIVYPYIAFGHTYEHDHLFTALLTKV